MSQSVTPAMPIRGVRTGSGHGSHIQGVSADKVAA